MKKNSLTTAIIAGVAGVAGLVGVAGAVNLNPDGLGQVLLYPYYTVNGGNSTHISVVNTTNSVKAVKVRFLESVNSAEVLDFNLYLSPYDVWGAEIQADGTSGASLRITDTSCTVPKISTGQPFVDYEFAHNTEDDLSGLGLVRTRQGHVEIIEMGVVTGALATAATHTSAGVPANCNALVAAWDGGAWSANPGTNIETPNGGLFGSAVIVSGEWGRTLSYNADAIDGFYTIPGGHLHFLPGDVGPTLAEAANTLTTATARIFSNGSLYQIDYDAGVVDSVSAVLASRYIYNEYFISPALAASSEWVVTFPTKRLHVFTLQSSYRLPFTAAFGTRGSCHAYDIKYWDREERTTTTRLIPSPPPPVAGFGLCFEANVIAFGQELGASTPTNILSAVPALGAVGLTPFAFNEGWARMELDDPNTAGFQYWLPAADGQSLVGQPVSGFWASELVNTDVGSGVRVNYGVIHKHRHSRDCRINMATSGSISAAATACPSL